MKAIEKIKTIRKEKNYSQSDIAKIINLSRVTYADIESGKIQLKADDMIKICNFLNIPLNEFNDDTKILVEKEKYHRILEITKELIDLLKEK